ncbi:MAG TPA: ATP-binding protein [Polyangiaceae bacterium]|nr:ATP-binding protein [Polyangiaceae bacterium]
MNAFDPLRTVEMIALLEEATTPLRRDLRTRIASIRDLSCFVRRKLSSELSPERDPRLPQCLAKVESEVQRTDDLMEAWGVSVYGLRSSEMLRVSVADCMRLAVDCARLPAQVGVEVRLPREPLAVEADLEMLALALRCLLENAAEAVGSGSIVVSSERQASQCLITVTDLGPGFGDKIDYFERFESTKPGHLGLGLCIARRIATRFGGDLAIGEPEVGAQVSLLVPLFGTRSASDADS